MGEVAEVAEVAEVDAEARAERAAIAMLRLRLRSVEHDAQQSEEALAAVDLGETKARLAADLARLVEDRRRELAAELAAERAQAQAKARVDATPAAAAPVAAAAAIDPDVLGRAVAEAVASALAEAPRTTTMRSGFDGLVLPLALAAVLVVVCAALLAAWLG